MRPVATDRATTTIKYTKQRPFYSNQRQNPLRIRVTTTLLASYYVARCLGTLWGVRSRVFTCPTFRRASGTTCLPAYLPAYLPTSYLPSTPLRPLYLPSSGFHALPPGFRNLWAPSTSFDRQRLLRKQQELALGRDKQGHEEGVIYKGSRGCKGGV